MLSTEIMGLIGVTVLVVIIFFITSLRDSETTKKLSRYEHSIDDLNRVNHSLRKDIINLTKQNERFVHEMQDVLEDEIKKQVQQNVYPLIESMREIENVMQNFQDEQIERINVIEDRSKDISFLPSKASISNEKIIISQYANGKSEAAIAKDLRISIGEVDLVLKLANLK